MYWCKAKNAYPAIHNISYLCVLKTYFDLTTAIISSTRTQGILHVPPWQQTLM